MTRSHQRSLIAASLIAAAGLSGLMATPAFAQCGRKSTPVVRVPDRSRVVIEHDRGADRTMTQTDPNLKPTQDPAPTPAAQPQRVTISNQELQKDEALGAELSKRKFVLTRDLQQIRHRYFRDVSAEKTRQQGLNRLREMAKETVALPLIVEIFQHEDRKTRMEIMSMLASMKTQPTDSTVAWMALTDTDAELRQAAATLIADRTRESNGEVPIGAQWAIAGALDSSDNALVSAAANMALNLRLIDAIPSMIAAQVSNPNAGAPGAGAIGQISIVTQRAFVSDLTPVVGNGAVGFDPQISTVSEGVVLRVFDAYVITYRTEVHSALVALSTQAMDGQSTAELGYDQAAWKTWYETTYLPYQAAKAKDAKIKSPAPAAQPVAPAAKAATKQQARSNAQPKPSDTY
ncbi:MAG: HEAT repeat domain-containing protein [Phycisphaerales bacterium]|nr:HEAT repeat domain-containing protein [Phycisphaerales bacterium]